MFALDWADAAPSVKTGIGYHTQAQMEGLSTPIRHRGTQCTWVVVVVVVNATSQHRMPALALLYIAVNIMIIMIIIFT
jgi:hypothetical protein